MSVLDAIRATDFDWAVRLDDVWSEPASDVDRLHAKLRAEFAEVRMDPDGITEHGVLRLGALVEG